MIINSTVKSRCSFSPNSAFLGRNLQLPVDNIFGVVTTKFYESGNQMAHELFYELRAVADILHEQQMKGLDYQKRYFNSKAVTYEYEKGDNVLVQEVLPAGTPFRSLKSPFKPMRIEERMSTNVYKLIDPTTGKIDVQHHDRLRPTKSEVKENVAEVTPDPNCEGETGAIREIERDVAVETPVTRTVTRAGREVKPVQRLGQ